MGKVKTALFFFIVAVSALCLTSNTFAEAPVWDDFPDVRLLIGEVNPVDIELAGYVFSTSTDQFVFSSADVSISGGNTSGMNPGTGVETGTAYVDAPGSAASDVPSVTPVILVATNAEGSSEEEMTLKYSKFIVSSPRMSSDKLFAGQTLNNFRFTHVLNATTVVTGATTVQTGNYELTSMGSPVATSALSWSAMVNRVAVNQIPGLDRSLNSAERRQSIFPLAPRNNPVLADTVTGVGVFVGNDGHYELTPHAAFSAPVLIGIRGDDMSGGTSLGYDGTFIFAAPAITGVFNFLTPAPNDLARDFSFEGITPGSVYAVQDFNFTINKWWLQFVAGPTTHTSLSGTYAASVVALSGLSAAANGPANTANQFPGAASGNVLQIVQPADTGNTPAPSTGYDELVPRIQFFYFSIQGPRGGTYTYSANVATNVPAAALPHQTPFITMMLSTAPYGNELSFNEIGGKSVPRDGKWMMMKSTGNFSNNFYSWPAQGNLGNITIETGGVQLYLGLKHPGDKARTTAHPGATVWFDNIRVYPSEFDVDLALGATEIPWTAYAGFGNSLITGNTPLTFHGDMEAVAGSGATINDNMPNTLILTGDSQLGDPTKVPVRPGVDVGIEFGVNNFVTPDVSSNGHSFFMDVRPRANSGVDEAGGPMFTFFDLRSFNPTQQTFQSAVYAVRMFVHTNGADYPHDAGHYAFAAFGLGRTDYANGVDPTFAAGVATVGIPNTPGDWRQVTAQQAFSAASVEAVPVGPNYTHMLYGMFFYRGQESDNGLNAAVAPQIGGANAFGVNGDKSPGGALNIAKIYVDDFSLHRVDDSINFYDESLTE